MDADAGAGGGLAGLRRGKALGLAVGLAVWERSARSTGFDFRPRHRHHAYRFVFRNSSPIHNRETGHAGGVAPEIYLLSTPPPQIQRPQKSHVF